MQERLQKIIAHAGYASRREAEAMMRAGRITLNGRGVTLDGKRTLPCEIAPIKTTGKTADEGNSWWEVKLREGRTQQIRKMFQAVGHPVSKLKRVAIGPIFDPKLSPGVWRELTKHEVKLLATLKDVPVKPRRVAAKRPAAKRPASKKKPAKTSRGTKSRSAKGRGATTSRGTKTSRAAKAPRSRAARRG